MFPCPDDVTDLGDAELLIVMQAISLAEDTILGAPAPADKAIGGNHPRAFAIRAKPGAGHTISY